DPDVSTNITYTVTTHNVDIVPMVIKNIEDWLRVAHSYGSQVSPRIPATRV
ncbi:unnamed protein product, partial [marine sediment metagenome]